MIEVYIMHLGDCEKAKRVYNRGITPIPDEEERDILRKIYNGICSRIDEPKEWRRLKTISVEARIRARKERKHSRRAR